MNEPCLDPQPFIKFPQNFGLTSWHWLMDSFCTNIRKDILVCKNTEMCPLKEKNTSFE